MFLLRHDAFDEALELSTRTLALDPTSPLSNRHRAQMLYAARRYDECIAVSRDRLLLGPHDVSLVLNWLPRCLEALGRRREAIEARVQSMAAHGAPARAARMMRLCSTRGWDEYWQEERRHEDASDLKTALVSVSATTIRRSHASSGCMRYDTRGWGSSTMPSGILSGRIPGSRPSGLGRV